MAATVTEIWRYPVKGLAGERLNHVRVTAGQTLPQDRRFAIAHGDSGITAENPTWRLKTSFHMLMHPRDERLAELTASYDDATDVLSIRRGNTSLASIRPGNSEAWNGLDAFFREYLKASGHGAPRFVEGDGFYFGNIEAPVISLINLASVRDLTGPAGGELDRRRFRGNFYVDGLKTWEEREWVERTLRLGRSRFKVVDETIRCGATMVNPQTFARDLNVPKIIEKSKGHMFCGVYLAALDSDEVSQGDAVALA